MKRKPILALSGLIILLLFGLAKISIGNANYSKEEINVQKQVIDTFSLDVNESDTNQLKPLFMREIFDKKVAKENPETRIKIAKAISSLYDEKEINEGDFKPMIFLKGNSEVLIGVKHPDNKISLFKFDISAENPKKMDKEVKEIK